MIWVLGLPKTVRHAIYWATSPYVMFISFMAEYGPRRWRGHFLSLEFALFSSRVIEPLRVVMERLASSSALASRSLEAMSRSWKMNAQRTPNREEK